MPLSPNSLWINWKLYIYNTINSLFRIHYYLRHDYYTYINCIIYEYTGILLYPHIAIFILVGHKSIIEIIKKKIEQHKCSSQNIETNSTTSIHPKLKIFIEGGEFLFGLNSLKKSKFCFSSKLINNKVIEEKIF